MTEQGQEAEERPAAEVIADVLALCSGPEWAADAIIPGYRERLTPRGVKIVEIDVHADPEKRDPAYLERARRSQRNEREFRREYLRDRTAAVGNAVYPEFLHNGGVKYYCRQIDTMMKGLPVARGWDLGGNCPALTWGQVSPNTGRLFYLREWVPKDIHTPTLGKVVMFLSGQIPESELNDFERERVEQLRVDPTCPAFPWFPPGTEFQDYSGPECFRRTFDVQADTEQTSSYEILAAMGIHLVAPRAGPKVRIPMMKSLLLGQATDGGPLVVFDVSCRYLIGALMGRLSYPKPTTLRPVQEKPRKDGTYDNVHDAAGYLAVNVMPLVHGSESEPGAGAGTEARMPIAVEDEFLMGPGRDAEDETVDSERYRR